ncbi:hypothetical protein BH20BAC1_BH20BAC1_01280 [soil metagenome]
MELVVVRTFNNYFSANILLTRLRSSGVECYLKDEYTVTVDPFLSNAVGGIKLAVKKENVEEVLELLHDFDDAYRKSAVCPRCGSHEIELVPKRTTANMVAAILSWIFSDYAVSAENVYQCQVCKFESADLPEPYQHGQQNLQTEKLN